MSVTRYVVVTNKNKDNEMYEGFLWLVSKSVSSVKELTNVVLKSLDINEPELKRYGEPGCDSSSKMKGITSGISKRTLGQNP
jgi:hypothetical protein